MGPFRAGILDLAEGIAYIQGGVSHFRYGLAMEGSPNGMAAVLKTAVPKGTWGFKSLTLRTSSSP